MDKVLLKSILDYKQNLYYNTALYNKGKTMRDYLLDLVEHTHDLGCVDLIKITGDDEKTIIDGIAEDRSVVVKGEFASPISEFIGVFGMPNLSNLKTILNIPEYREDAKITLKSDTKNGSTIPVGLHFENKSADFKNDYRFMVSDIINDKLKGVKFKGANWHVEFEPTVASIQRLKFQAQANPDETTFQSKTDDGNLKFYFGDHSTHAGDFVFQPNVVGTLKQNWHWPIKTIINILDVTGDKVMKISDDGATEITVDSGLATYNYILPAQSK